MSYNLVPLRDLIKNLTDQEFLDLVFYHFPAIKQQFTPGMEKSEQIRILLEHIDKHQELDDFLDKVVQERPDLFNKYEAPENYKKILRERVLKPSRLSKIREKSLQNSRGFDSIPNFNSSLDSSLLILIKPLELNYFQIQAWFWSPIKQCLIQEAQIIKFIVNESTEDECSQKFSQKITELITESNKLMKEIGSEDLRIELFLSSDLLKRDNYYFDWIEIKKAGFSEKMCKKYPVVFRLAERLEVDYQDSIGDWKRRWRQIQIQIQPNNCPLITYGQNIQAHNIGIILDKISNIEDFFSSIYWQAIPIALWSRCDLTTIPSCQAINQIVNDPKIMNNFQQLPFEIKNQRNAAPLGAEHIGHHICLLWDDPERMPPNESSPEYSLSSI